MVIVVAGGIIGIITGVLIGQLIAAFSDMSVVVSLAPILLSFGFSGFVGVAFGYYPAYKASKLNPIDALRYE